MDETDLGGALRALRSARGLSLDATAIASDVPRATLSAWEIGTTRPRGKALARLLDALEADSRLRARLLHAADPAFAHIILPNTPLGAPVSVGLVIRAMRVRRNATQADLARAVGVNQGTVARWESGESIPSGPTLHRVAFALGATPEEAVALGCATGGESGRIPDDPTDLDAVPTICGRTPTPLREVVSLGLEAELWRRSARDARWDPVYCRLLGDRASTLFDAGRLGEAEDAARRAVRRATSPEARSEASVAVGTLVALARHEDSPPAALAARLEGWIEKIPDSRFLGYMVWERARMLARMGRDEAALDEMGRVMELHWADYDGDCYGAYSYNASKYWIDLLAETSHPERAAELIPDISADTSHMWMMIGIPAWHAAGHAVPEVCMTEFRAWVVGGPGDVWIQRERLDKMERDQARLLGAA